MRRAVLVALVLTGCSFERLTQPPAPDSLPPCPAEGRAGPLRIVSWNIHKGDDGTIDELAAHLALFDPDVVALQEARVRAAGPESPDQPLELARALSRLTGQRYDAVFVAARSDGTGHMGNAILSRVAMTSPERIDLHDGLIQQPRAALAVNLCTAPGPVSFVVAHLDHLNPQATAETLSAWLDTRLGTGVVVAGDFNAGQDDPALRALVRDDRFVDPARDAPATFPLLNRRIDYVLFEPTRFDATPLPVPTTARRDLSDHLPVALLLTPR